MSSWWRRLRATLVVGATWGLAWFGAGLVMLAIVGFGAADVPFPLFFGFLGFLAGTTFSGVLALVERHRRFDQMSLPRFAGWGALGGLALSLVISAAMGGGELAVLAPVFATAGAASAAGSLAIARRARSPRLLPADEDSTE